MSVGIESDRALGPVVRRMRRWIHNAVSRVGDGIAPEDRRTLDPLTVNYAAWREMRRHVREWPRYREAPNFLEVLVSPEDWDDYWGVDTERKEEAVTTYVRARAAEKGYWIAGNPKVEVVADDAMAIGEVEVTCQFVSAPDGASPRPASQLEAPSGHAVQPESNREPRPASDAARDFRTIEFSPEGTTLFVGAEQAGSVYLIGEDGAVLTLHSGDCVGAVTPEDDVPEDVTVRLKADTFPYAEAKHFSIGVVGGRWCIVNHASTGTKIVPRDGGRLMLHEAEPFPLTAGDMVYLGPCGPMRFEFA